MLLDWMSDKRTQEDLDFFFQKSDGKHGMPSFEIDNIVEGVYFEGSIRLIVN